MRYTKSHEWISPNGEVGITDYAKNELGEIVFVELPKIGSFIEAGQQACVLESTKAAVDVYSPVSGKVIAINNELVGLPSAIKENKSWLFRLELTNPQELEQLLSEQEYIKITSKGGF